MKRKPISYKQYRETRPTTQKMLEIIRASVDAEEARAELPNISPEEIRVRYVAWVHAVDLKLHTREDAHEIKGVCPVGAVGFGCGAAGEDRFHITGDGACGCRRCIAVGGYDTETWMRHLLQIIGALSPTGRATPFKRNPRTP